MNGENFGGSYNGYGFNADGTEKERNDLTPEDFSRNENLGHGTLDSYRKEEIAEEVEEQGYEETVREDLDHLFAELDKQPHNAKILGYIESTKEILARLEEEVKAEPAAETERPMIIDQSHVYNLPPNPDPLATAKQPEGERESVTNPVGVDETKKESVAGPDGLLTSREMFLGEDRD